MKQINSFYLSDNIVNDMKNKLKETRNNELGFALCTQKDNFLVKGTDCIGNECSIKVGKCREDQIYVGNFHTHPRGTATLSITDMLTGCLEHVECVGSVPYKNIRCFVRKTDSHQCYNEVSPFKEEEFKVVERSLKLKSAITNPIKLIKMGASQFIKEFRQHDKEIGKYQANRSKLLNKNFNRIDVK